MSVDDLIARTREAARNRTPLQRAELLRQANILDQNGNYKEGYFTSATIAKSKINK